MVQRAVRREMDRLTGEIMRRWDEDGELCVRLDARRQRLQATVGHTWRGVRALVAR